jgi:hypothetical protein
MKPFLRPVSKEHVFTRNPHPSPNYEYPAHADDKRQVEKQEEPSGDSEMPTIELMVKDFMKAMERKDVKAMAIIIKLAHDILHEYME